MPTLEQFYLHGNTALVTGGSALSRTIALALAEAGADIAAASRNVPAVEETARQVRDIGRRSLALEVDVTDPNSVQAMVRRVLDQFEHLDILVNAEEVILGKPLLDMTVEEMRRVMDVNVIGTLLCCQAVGPHMIERHRGRIINLATGLAVRGVVNGTAYCASKGAIENLTQALALEWGPHGITVNALGPGWFAEGPIDFERDRAENVLVRMIPQQRRGVPEDIAGLVVYMASEAGSYLTAQTVFVDGGILCHG